MFLWGCLKQRRREAKGRHGGGYPRYQDCRERKERVALVPCAPETAVPTVTLLVLSCCPSWGWYLSSCIEFVSYLHQSHPHPPLWLLSLYLHGERDAPWVLCGDGW